MSAVVTRMQNLASEFLKIPGVKSRTPQREETTPGLTPVLGPKPWPFQLFSRGCAPV